MSSAGTRSLPPSPPSSTVRGADRSPEACAGRGARSAASGSAAGSRGSAPPVGGGGAPSEQIDPDVRTTHEDARHVAVSRASHTACDVRVKGCREGASFPVYGDEPSIERSKTMKKTIATGAAVV